MQYFCTLFLILFVTSNVSLGVPIDQFYSYGEVAGDKKLPAKDEGATSELDLKVPFVFYGETYFSLFVNINGIISFLTEIPYFFNAQFPLDYPVIAPFYSDVDTTGTGNIYYRETSDIATVQRVALAVDQNFENSDAFQPESVFIVTWDAVGSFQSRRDKVNTFQVVMATDRRESYIIINYADGGLLWLQGDGKTSGLPDALGQAGFIAADGRLFTISGSGTDQVRNLAKWSNVGLPGVWMFRVGRILPGKNIEPPNKVEGLPNLDGMQSYSQYSVDGTSCASGGSVCHSSATCNDYENGFCCSCKEEFYGNGINCLPKENPIRVTGKLSGTVNGIEITDADLHSYVLSSQGRTYTAVSRIPKDIGFDVQSLTGIAEGIAWLFAVPKDWVSNGFSLTGGFFNRTVEVTFPQTGHKAVVQQTFEGLDVFNNVAVSTKITGSLPTVPIGAELEVDAFNEEFTRVRKGHLRAHSSRNFRLKGHTIETPYKVETFIHFNECEHAPRDQHFDTLRMKVAENIFIRFDEAESIVRYSFTAKTGTLEEEDPCIKGRAECGLNSQCIVEGDYFRCDCEQGYDNLFDAANSVSLCLDINECDTGRHQCHQNALCINSPGSYGCRCTSGYTGDGYYCNPEITCANAGCDPNASCRVINGLPECECSIGYTGDGFFCTPDFGDDSCHVAQNCSPYAVCAPNANGYSCRCLQGYTGDGYICKVDRTKLIDHHDQGHIIIPFDSQGSSHPLDLPIDHGQVPNYHEPFDAPTLRPLDLYPQPDQSFDNTNYDAIVQRTCISNICWCPKGYDYNQELDHCSLTYPEDINKYAPNCESGKCICPRGLLYNPLEGRCYPVSEAPPCNFINNCHPNAQCLYHSSTKESSCICSAGYTGDGIFCSPLELSCDQVDICHFNADCIYDDSQLKSTCACKPGFEGDGLVCTPLDDCSSATDCDQNAQCIFDPLSQRFVCKCNDWFEGNGFFCNAVQEENCVTLDNCDSNAECVFEAFIKKHLCICRNGYEGNGYSCKEVKLSCNVLNDCGQNADCIYDAATEGFQCTCRRGFTGNGFFCRALHSCINDPSVCDSNALCQRSSTGEYEHECFCTAGYTGNGYHCEKIPDHEKNILFVNQGLSVLRMPIDPSLGNGYPIHVDPYMTAVGADIDCLAGVYYWTDVGSRSIRSSKYDGSDRKPVITGEKIGSPEDVAIDWVSKNIYWTDSSNDVVAVGNIEGTLIRTVIEGDLVNPRGITVHPGLGLLFWSDWNRNNPKIEKSGMDGSDRKVIVSGPGVSLPNSLIIDFESSNLCWADAGTHRIECIGTQGFGRRIIVEEVKYPFGLALHKSSLFYTDWNDTRVHQVGLYNGREESVRSPPPGGSGKLYGIVSAPEQCPPVSNVCQVNRGNCPATHLCLPNGSWGRVCACPNQSEGSQCSDYQSGHRGQ